MVISIISRTTLAKCAQLSAQNAVDLTAQHSALNAKASFISWIMGVIINALMGIGEIELTLNAMVRSFNLKF